MEGGLILTEGGLTLRGGVLTVVGGGGTDISWTVGGLDSRG
jgi:hypothetical protein